MVRRRFRVDRCEAERRVRAASGLRLVCGSSMVWPHLLHTSASVRRMPWHTHIMAHLRSDPHTVHGAPCTWHTHTMYLAHPYYGTTYTPFRRPVQTPRSDAPARTAPHILTQSTEWGSLARDKSCRRLRTRGGPEHGRRRRSFESRGTRELLPGRAGRALPARRRRKTLARRRRRSRAALVP